MQKNKILGKAKVVKNDEFYTRYDDIEKEIESYISVDPNMFRDKVIYSPCDDPSKSNFVKYFINNFERLGIRKYIATSYTKKNKAFSITNGKYLEVNRDNLSLIDVNNIDYQYLIGSGDFRSAECVNILKSCVELGYIFALILA